MVCVHNPTEANSTDSKRRSRMGRSGSMTHVAYGEPGPARARNDRGIPHLQPSRSTKPLGQTLLSRELAARPPTVRGCNSRVLGPPLRVELESFGQGSIPGVQCGSKGACPVDQAARNIVHGPEASHETARARARSAATRRRAEVRRMYIYDRNVSSVPPHPKSQPMVPRPVQDHPYYPVHGAGGLLRRGGNSGSYVESERLGKSQEIGPFASHAYGPRMIFDAQRTKDLTDAIRAVKTTLSPKNQQRLEKVAFVIAKLGTGEDPVRFAGVKMNDMYFSASLLKVTLLYASFELMSRVNELGPRFLPGGSPEAFLDNVRLAFGPSITSAVPSIPAGEWRNVKFGATLVPKRRGSGVYTVELDTTDLKDIFADQNQDRAARACMRRLGYSYVNGALAAAGLFDPKAKKGIWYANDLGGGWPQFYVPVATGGKSSAAMTALAMAKLLTAMHRGTLIDQKSSREMMSIMSTGGSWLAKAASAASLSFTSSGAKVGHYASADAKVSKVKSEGVFLDRNGIPFVAVWQNYPDLNPDVVSDVINVYRVIDEVVKKWP